MIQPYRQKDERKIDLQMDANARQVALQTKGFLDDSEGMRLYALAREASALGPCLEIGGYCGRSTLYIASACKERDAVLFSVDHHRGSEEQQPGELYFDPMLVDPRDLRVHTLHHFMATIQQANLFDTVVPVVARSVIAGRAWKTPLSMVFIDGGHADETVLSDYQTWAPHVLPQGFLVFHDVYPDPADGGQAPYRVYSMALQSGEFVALSMTGSLGVLRRVSMGGVEETFF